MVVLLLAISLSINSLYLIWWGRHMKKYITYLEFESEKHIMADEITLEFFRKYLDMPKASLEELCREIVRLKKEST